MKRFIEGVSRHHCLWNTDQQSYHNFEKKEIAWKEVISTSNHPEITDIKTAKAQWKKLRDNHRDSLKRTKGKTGQAVNTWKYAKIMEFLIPYMKNRKKSTYLRDALYTCDPNTRRLTQDTTDQQFTQDTNDHQLAGDTSDQDVSNLDVRKKTDTDIIKTFDKIKNEQQKNLIKRDVKHPVDTFFESMAQTTKGLPMFIQHRIKRKVLEIVCEAEEEVEVNNVNESYSSTSSTQS